MTLDEKIKKAYDLKLKSEELQKKQEELKTELTTIQTESDSLLNEILIEMKNESLVEKENDDLVAQYFCKNEFSYGDEKNLLSKLQELSLNQYIKVVTTTKTSIDKISLKKALKTDLSLKESLKDFVGDRTTEYVVVTTKEKHQRMLEHIEEGNKDVK